VTFVATAADHAPVCSDTAVEKSENIRAKSKSLCPLAASGVDGGGDVAASGVAGGGDVAASDVAGGGDVAACDAAGGGDVAASGAAGGGDVAASGADDGGDVGEPTAAVANVVDDETVFDGTAFPALIASIPERFTWTSTSRNISPTMHCPRTCKSR
jgi:hypothetical protein